MELESGADSVTSTPRSIHHNKTAEDKAVLRLMCSFGGKIIPRPHDNQLRYVGGDTRIVAIHRSTTFSSLLSKLSKLAPMTSDFTVKYQLPNEDLDALITVSTDEDVENMIDEFDRLSIQTTTKSTRLRLFLFPNNGDEDSTSNSSIVSLLDGSRKRENWFLDALNGNNNAGLERGRSEVSSIVSEVPDYLFGLDNSDDPTRLKNRVGLVDPVVGSDPGSPAAPPLPNLPPVKTKLENPVEDTVGYTGGPVWNPSLNTNPNQNPGSPYPGHAHSHHTMQAIPVYYVPRAVSGPGPVPVQGGHYIQQYGPGQVPVPVMYPSSGPVYAGGPVRHVGGVDPYEMQMQGNVVSTSSGSGQPVYYAGKNMMGPYPGMVVPVKADEAGGSGSEPNKNRSLPA